MAHARSSPLAAGQCTSTILCVLVALVASGCRNGRPARARLEYGSGDDVEAIVRRAGVAVGALECRNARLGGSVVRSVTCTMALRRAQIDVLTRQIPLAVSHGEYLTHADSDSCATLPEFAADAGSEILVGQNRVVPNGVGRVEVRWLPGSSRACIQVVYPWSS